MEGDGFDRGSGAQPTPQQYFWTTLVSKNGGKTWGEQNEVALLGTVSLPNRDLPNPTSLNQTIRGETGDTADVVAVRARQTS